MEKLGQVSIIAFLGLIVILLILAPFLMKIVSVPLQKFSSALNQSGANETAINAVNYGEGKFRSFFDTIILIAFIVNVILLLITSFFVDAHPAFLIIYIISVLFVFLFSPLLLEMVTKIWDTPELNTDGSGATTLLTNNLPMTRFIVDNFLGIMLGIIILSGVIIYAKIKYT